MAHTFIDLGLPSGTLWATENEPHYLEYWDAVHEYFVDGAFREEKFPSQKEWTELFENCETKWDHERFVIIGPNGNKIYLQADGDSINGGKGIFGHYWTSSYDCEHKGYALAVHFDRACFTTLLRAEVFCAFSVRLCKPAGAQ